MTSLLFKTKTMELQRPIRDLKPVVNNWLKKTKVRKNIRIFKVCKLEVRQEKGVGDHSRDMFSKVKKWF